MKFHSRYDIANSKYMIYKCWYNMSKLKYMILYRKCNSKSGCMMNKLVMSDMLLYNMNNMVTGNIQHNKLYSTSYMSNKYIEYKIQNSESSVNNEYMSDMNILV